MRSLALGTPACGLRPTCDRVVCGVAPPTPPPQVHPLREERPARASDGLLACWCDNLVVGYGDPWGSAEVRPARRRVWLVRWRVTSSVSPLIGGLGRV